MQNALDLDQNPNTFDPNPKHFRYCDGEGGNGTSKETGFFLQSGWKILDW